MENVTEPAPQTEPKFSPKVYTKGGDRGSSLVGYDEDNFPIRIDKDSPIMELWGSLDTLSSWLGTCEDKTLRQVQVTLFKISGYLYNKQIDIDYMKKCIAKLERFCDKNENSMPSEFVIPTGKIHFARALARESERRMVVLAKTNSIDGTWQLVRYLNRLSSWLFIYAELEPDVFAE